jgi:hypothetical protein
LRHRIDQDFIALNSLAQDLLNGLSALVLKGQQMNQRTIDLHMQRAIDVAQSIKAEYQQHIEGKPQRQVNIWLVEALESKLDLLNSIFAIDVDGERRIANPLCEIIDPLINALRAINEDVRALMSTGFKKIKETASND